MKKTNNASTMPPRHGGNLDHAIKQFGGAREQWTDLSTGISPWVYPIPAIGDDLWRELPRPSIALERIAANFYKTTPEHICVTPGSQLAIRILPTLIEKQTIAIPLIGYQEHRYAWQEAGHTVLVYDSTEELQALANNASISSAVVINPNNPSNELIAQQTLLEIAHNLKGLLIVDEAFADYDPTQSVISKHEVDNLIVIRSIGKFFGLAGARIGFLIGSHPSVSQLKSLFSPWSINAPAQHIAGIALQDTQWQIEQIQRIKQHSLELETVLMSFIKQQKLDLDCRSNGLFTSLFGKHTLIIGLHHLLAEKHFWTRIGDPFIATINADEEHHNWLRLSLAGDSLHQLEHTLLSINLTAL